MMSPAAESHAEWDRFQARFLAVLKREGDAAAIKRRLCEGELSAEQRAWVESMRPEMLETAAMLVKRWGRGGEG